MREKEETRDTKQTQTQTSPETRDTKRLGSDLSTDTGLRRARDLDIDIDIDRSEGSTAGERMCMQSSKEQDQGKPSRKITLVRRLRKSRV